MKHRRTDPACARHRPIRGLLVGWRERRSHGRSCDVCFPRCDECGGGLTYVIGDGVEAQLCGSCDATELEWLTS